MEQTVKELTKNQDTANQVQDAISDYEIALIDAYFSLEMKAGVRLNSLLMGGFDKDY